MRNIVFILLFSCGCANISENSSTVICEENNFYEKQLVCELLVDLKLCIDKSRDDDVHLLSYIIIWTRLQKVLDEMGSVFKFVSSDVDDKIKILRKTESEQDFSTIEKMMKEEKSAGKINYKRVDVDHPSGSRTLLVLHRAFKMISNLLGKLSRNEHDGKMSTIAYESYHSSPMPAHHPWYIRKSIDVAVYTLPDSQSFCQKIAPELSGEELLETLKDVEELLEEIFSRIDFLYIKNKL